MHGSSPAASNRLCTDSLRECVSGIAGPSARQRKMKNAALIMTAAHILFAAGFIGFRAFIPVKIFCCLP